MRDSRNSGPAVERRKARFVPGSIPSAWRRKAERTANLIESFYHASRGFIISFKSERNLRIHVVIAIVVAALALTLHVDASGCALLTLAIGLVITAELINTALERLVDITTNHEFHRIARDAKDTAAAAVLCAALMAALIGAIVFLPKLTPLIHLISIK